MPSPQFTVCHSGRPGGRLDFYGRKPGLPPALSGHNSYHVWGNRGCDGEVMIVIGDDRRDLQRVLESVELATT